MTEAAKPNIGILAFGSLITSPGSEIEPLIAARVQTNTPFGVEYGRFSRTRSGAPTLVRHPRGAPVKAEILVLPATVTFDLTRDMLWRRERHCEGSGERYVERRSGVLVRTITDHRAVSILLYTDFPDRERIVDPDPVDLAHAAIESVQKAAAGMDGISYLSDAISSGILTPLTDSYQAAILRLTKTASLAEALASLTAE